MDNLIFEYYKYRGYKMPPKLDALLFLISEIGELADAVLMISEIEDKNILDVLRVMRITGMSADLTVSKDKQYVRNNDRLKEPNVADEVGDCLQMLEVFSHQYLEKSARECMLAKFIKKGFTHEDYK